MGRRGVRTAVLDAVRTRDLVRMTAGLPTFAPGTDRPAAATLRAAAMARVAAVLVTAGRQTLGTFLALAVVADVALRATLAPTACVLGVAACDLARALAGVLVLAAAETQARTGARSALLTAFLAAGFPSLRAALSRPGVATHEARFAARRTAHLLGAGAAADSGDARGSRVAARLGVGGVAQLAVRRPRRAARPGERIAAERVSRAARPVPAWSLE
jgi:hypothetical protein